MCFGSLSASYLFIPVWFARPLPRGPDNSPCGCQKMFPAERSSRRVSERHLRRGKTAFPASFQPGYKELLFFFCCSAGFLFVSCLGCPGASQRHNIAPLVFQAQPTAARPAKHPFVSVCSSSLFSLFIMVLLPRAFMFSYNPPPTIILPFLPMNQTLWIPHALLQAK